MEILFLNCKSCLLSNWFSFHHHLHNRSTHSSHKTRHEQQKKEKYRKHFEWKQILGISYVKQFNVKHHHYQCCCQKFTLFEYYRMGFFKSFLPPPPSTTKTQPLLNLIISAKSNKSVLPKPITSWQYGFLNVLSTFIACVITQSLCLSVIIL